MDPEKPKQLHLYIDFQKFHEAAVEGYVFGSPVAPLDSEVERFDRLTAEGFRLDLVEYRYYKA